MGASLDASPHPHFVSLHLLGYRLTKKAVNSSESSRRKSSSGFPQTSLTKRVAEVGIPTEKARDKMQHQLRRKMILLVQYNLTNVYT